jgi:hypothetical protein
MSYNDKKEYQSFLIYREIQSGAYIRKGFLIYEEMRKYFPIYEEAVSNCFTLNFLIYEENLIFFFISVGHRARTVPPRLCKPTGLSENCAICTRKPSVQSLD